MEKFVLNVVALILIGVIFTFFVGLFFEVKNKNLRTKVSWWVFALITLGSLIGFDFVVYDMFLTFIYFALLVLEAYAAYLSRHSLSWLVDCWLDIN